MINLLGSAGKKIAVSLIASSGLITGSYNFCDSIRNKYGPTEEMQLPMAGEKVNHNGKEYTVFGYSGHKGDTAEKLELVGREVWIALDKETAANYAGQGGGIAIIAGEKRAPLGLSRYDNMHAPHLPSEEHGYTTLKVFKVTEHNDPTFFAAVERAWQSLWSD